MKKRQPRKAMMGMLAKAAMGAAGGASGGGAGAAMGKMKHGGVAKYKDGGNVYSSYDRAMSFANSWAQSNGGGGTKAFKYYDENGNVKSFNITHQNQVNKDIQKAKETTRESERIKEAEKNSQYDDNLRDAYMRKGGIARRRGLWDNIHAKKKRIAAGSGEKMRKPGSKGAPTAKALRESQAKRGMMVKANKGKKFPDLTGDGKTTRADILKGRGVFKHGGKIKPNKKNNKGMAIIIAIGRPRANRKKK